MFVQPWYLEQGKVGQAGVAGPGCVLLIVPAGAGGCTGTAWAAPQLIIDIFPKSPGGYLEREGAVSATFRLRNTGTCCPSQHATLAYV